MPPEEPSDGRPPRRRDSWSLTSLVEEVAGHPITEFQEPGRPVHPYIQAKFLPNGSPRYPRAAPARPLVAADSAVPEEDLDDPVRRVFPPLTGATGRQLHGPEHEHHPAILRSVVAEAAHSGPGSPPHAPGPSRRPERIYLHYLLLHLDRLNGPSLRYLKHAVDEEVAHRESPPRAAETPPAPSGIEPPAAA